MRKKKKPSFFALLRERCEWFETRPQLFPELYGDVSKRWPDHRVLKSNRRMMEELTGVADLETMRVGTPRADGSVYGLTEANLAVRTGLGDPRVRGRQKHWRGRRVVQRCLKRLREGGCISWGKPEWWEKGRACNPRVRIKTGPHAGDYRIYPSVRVISEGLLRRLRVDISWTRAIEQLKLRRAAGLVPPIVDVQRRRARDREIKRRVRAERRLTAPSGRAVAARTSRRQE